MSSVPGDGARCVSQLRVAGSCNRIGRITRGGGAPQLMMLRLLRMGLRVKLLAMGVMRGLLSSGGSVFYQGRYGNQVRSGEREGAIHGAIHGLFCEEQRSN